MSVMEIEQELSDIQYLQNHMIVHHQYLSMIQIIVYDDIVDFYFIINEKKSFFLLR